MKFEIKNRWSGAVQFTAEIDCAEDASPSIKLNISRGQLKTRAALIVAMLEEHAYV